MNPVGPQPQADTEAERDVADLLSRADALIGFSRQERERLEQLQEQLNGGSLSGAPPQPGSDPI